MEAMEVLDTLVEIVENSTAAAVETSEIDCDKVDLDYLYERFYIAVIVGGLIAAASIFENCFLFLLFVTSKQHRNSYNLYLLLLAFFDVFMSISYIALFAVRVLTNWTGSYALRSVLMKYIIPMLTISQIAMTASVFLITFAAIERYCITVNNNAVRFLQRNRKSLAFIAVMCGVISKVTILKEIQVTTILECSQKFGEFRVDPGAIVLNNPNYNTYWRFWFRNIFTILAPFFVLLTLNLLLAVRLKFYSAGGTMVADKQNIKQKKARIRAATRTLVILVCTYLMSNILSVIITLWEMIDSSTLWSESYLQFYVLSVDAISILTIVACSLRLPIYASCQPLLRKEMQQFICTYGARCCPQLWTKKKLSRRATIIETQQLGQSLLAGLGEQGQNV